MRLISHQLVRVQEFESHCGLELFVPKSKHILGTSKLTVFHLPELFIQSPRERLRSLIEAYFQTLHYFYCIFEYHIYSNLELYFNFSLGYYCYFMFYN